MIIAYLATNTFRATNISVSVGIACTSLLITPVLALYIVSMRMDKKVADSANH